MPKSNPKPPSSLSKRALRPKSRTFTTATVTSVLQKAHNIVFKREEDQWPTIGAPTALDSPRTSATTAFFKLDQRNMERVAPVEIVLPEKVRSNVEKNLKMKARQMMMGSIIPGKNTKGKKNSAELNHQRMRIAAPAGQSRSRGSGSSNNAQASLQNRFASRRSYIPMAQETPAMREVRIERHRKKQFAQRKKQHKQDILKKMQKNDHLHTSHIETRRNGRRQSTADNGSNTTPVGSEGNGKAIAGHHTREELETNKTKESEADNRQMQVLTALMKRVGDSAKFFADESIARSVMTEVDQDEMSGLRRGFDMNPGGLTLAQFIELMMGFVPVSEEEEHEIQHMHTHHHHHLHHKHHHKHHTNNGHVVHVKGKARLQLARNLCELFEQIDINGDGTLEWDEFTSYCVSQGLANDNSAADTITRYKLQRAHHCYKEGFDVIDNMTSFVLNGNEWDITKANIIRMARQKSKSTATKSSGDGKTASDDGHGSGGNTSKKKMKGGMTFVTCDRNAIHKGTFSIRDPQTGKLIERCGKGVHKNSILAVCYIPCMEYIVTSSSDLTLGFWDSHKHDLRQLMPVNEEMHALHWVNAKDAGLTIAGSNGVNADTNASMGSNSGTGESSGEGSGGKNSDGNHISSMAGTLYTGGVNGEITGWDVVKMFTEATLIGHTDTVTAFLSIPTLRLLVSSSMDSTVRIWNLRSNAPLKVLRGHARGVSSIAFSNEQRVLLSCGFDHEIFVWNPYVETRTSGKLRGHTCSVLSVTCVEGTKEAISVDMEGNMRIWDLRTLMCVQTLTAHEAEGGADNHLYDHVHNPNTPNPDMFKDTNKKTGSNCLSWCYVHHPAGNRIMVATERHLRVYAYDEVQDPRVADKHVSNTLVYNPLTSSFLTVGGQNCKNWDAATGKLLSNFENIIEEDKVEITAVCYDDQYRQFLLGDTLGRIRMYQCANGQLLRDLVSHSDGGEVIAIMFNRVTDCIYSSSSKGQLIAQEDDGEGTEEQDADGDAIVPPHNSMGDNSGGGSGGEGIGEDGDGDGDDTHTDKNVGREAGELFRRTRHELVRFFTRKYAPPCEVTSLVQGSALGLLAWGATDGDVVIVDCVTGHTEGVCIPATVESTTLKARSPVTALTFLEPYPLLAVSYGDGSICIWSVRPFYIRQCPLMIFYNYKKPKIHVSPALAASAPWVLKRDVHPLGETVEVLKLCWDVAGRSLLGGDGNGSVLKWNLRYMLLKLRIREFHEAQDADGEQHASENEPKKLGDVLHPDLKRTTMSAREQLEETLAATPREFEDPPPEQEEEDKTELVGLSWLGKIRRQNKTVTKKSSPQVGFKTVKAAVRITAGDKSQDSVRNAEPTEAAAATTLDVAEKGKDTSTFALTEVKDSDSDVAHSFLHILASGGQNEPSKKEEKKPRSGLQTAASRRAYAHRSYAAQSREKSKLQYGKILSGDAAQLVDAKPCHHDAVCELLILKGMRAVASSGHDNQVIIRSLDSIGGTLDSDDEDDNEADDAEEDVLGHLWQGFPDPKWHLGPLVKKQMEVTLSYELKRASAILNYMDERDAQYQKVNQQFFASGNARRRGGGGGGGGGMVNDATKGRVGSMAVMLGTKTINGQKQMVLKKKSEQQKTAQLQVPLHGTNSDSDSGSDYGNDDRYDSDNSSSSSSSSSASSASSYQSSVNIHLNLKDDLFTENHRFQALNSGSGFSHRRLGAEAGINGAEMLRLVVTEGVRPPRERKARFQKASVRLKRVSRSMRHDPKAIEEQRNKERAKVQHVAQEKATKENEDVAQYVRRQSTVASSAAALALMKGTSSRKTEAEQFLKEKLRRKTMGFVAAGKKGSGGVSAAARRQKLAQDRVAKAQGEMKVLW